jgi:hypothetical protein
MQWCHILFVIPGMLLFYRLHADMFHQRNWPGNRAAPHFAVRSLRFHSTDYVISLLAARAKVTKRALLLNDILQYGKKYTIMYKNMTMVVAQAKILYASILLFHQLKPHCIQSSRMLVPAGTSKSTSRRHGIQAVTRVMAYVAFTELCVSATFCVSFHVGFSLCTGCYNGFQGCCRRGRSGLTTQFCFIRPLTSPWHLTWPCFEVHVK